MLFADKINTLWDEVSWGADSFMRGSLYRVQSNAVSRGSIGGSDITDYYALDLVGGDYTLYVSTEGLNASAISNTSFKAEIVDGVGNLIFVEDGNHPDPYTDAITFSYDSSSDYYLKITSLSGVAFNYAAATYPTVMFPETDDYPESAATTGSLPIGGTSNGAIEAAGDYDWFKVVLTAGTTYRFEALGTDTSNGSLADPYLEIYDNSGANLKSDDDSGAGFNADLTFTPASSGTYFIAASEGSDLYTGTYTVRATVVTSEPLEPPAADDWRLYAGSAFQGAVGGSGRVFGTAGIEKVAVFDLPGNVVFDATFNKGGDTIRIFGDAADWTIARSASYAVLSDGDTFAQIPFGTFGTSIMFDDGTRMLRYDQQTSELLIGAQVLGTTTATIVASADATADLTGLTAEGAGTLIVAQESIAFAGGNLKVLGTNSSEGIGLLFGIVQLDASFNKGGDVIGFGSEATTFYVQRSGSTAIFENQLLNVSVPVGPQGTEMQFVDDTRTLFYDINQSGYFLGTQAITTDPAPLIA